MAAGKVLVLVVWHDATDTQSDESWHREKDLLAWAETPCEVTSLGFQLSKTAKYITIAGDRCANDDGSFTYGRPTKIPIGMVQSITELPIESGLEQSAFVAKEAI